MSGSDLQATAKAMVAPGRGILAADESSPTIKKRFDQIDVPSTEENRRAYRSMLFTTEDAERFISGVIMFDETIRQSTVDGGIPFPQYLAQKGIIPGIKVDTGAKPWRVILARRSRRGLTVSGNGWRNTVGWGQGLLNGGQSSPLLTEYRQRHVSRRMPTPSPGTRPSVRKRDSFPSWNPRSS